MACMCTTFVSKSKDNFRCQSVPSTLFEVGLLADLMPDWLAYKFTGTPTPTPTIGSCCVCVLGA